MKTYLNKVMQGQNLSLEEAFAALNTFLEDEASNEEMAGLLAALRTKGESGEEIAGFAKAVLKDSSSVIPERTDLVDTCGTGGDGANTFNISTTVAFVVAGAGLGVAKHGNRSVSSLSGSADVLEELRLKTDLNAEEAAKEIDEKGFAFLFAPLYHPAVKKIMPVRKALGVRTIFNIMGPLMSPAHVKRQVVGVFDQSIIGVMAEALKKLGSVKALTVAADDGLDEISIASPTKACLLADGEVQELTLTPEMAGLSLSSLEDIKGGGPKDNALITEKILRGEGTPAQRDVVAINAGAALWIADHAEDLKLGTEMALQVLSEGKGFEILESVRS